MAESASLIEGTKLLELGLVEDAARVFAREVQAHPEDPAAVLALARALLALDRRDEAEPVLHRLLTLRPNHPEGTSHLARVRAERGDERALDALRALSADRNARFHEHYNLGVVMLRRGALDEAEAALERAHKLAPKNPQALAFLGEIDRRRGKLQRAIERLTAASALDRRQAYPQLQLGRALAAAGKVIPAIQALTEAIRRNTSTWEAYEDLVRLYIAAGMPPRAVQAASALRARRPTSGQAAYLLGLAHLVAGRVDEARQALEESITEAPEAWESRHTLARAETLAKNHARARALLEEAARLAPTQVAPVLDLGLLLIQVGQREEAARVLSSGLQRHPGHPGLHLNLALALADRDAGQAAEHARAAAARGNAAIREQAERLLSQLKP